MFTSDMTSDMEDILRRVAAGELTPEEALPLLDAAGAGRSPQTSDQASDADAGADLPAWGTPPGPAATNGAGGREPDTGPVRLIRINASYRPLQIVADPSVAEAFVTGEHTVHRDGSALVIEGGVRFGGDDEGAPRFSFSPLPQTLAWARSLQNDRLLVRVNPALPVELDAVGSSVKMSGGEAGARMRLLAAALKVDALRGPLDIDASSSSIKGTIGPSGASRIAAESSS